MSCSKLPLCYKQILMFFLACFITLSTFLMEKQTKQVEDIHQNQFCYLTVAVFQFTDDQGNLINTLQVFVFKYKFLYAFPFIIAQVISLFILPLI